MASVKGSDDKVYDLVHVRNPWGSERWAGRWADNSTLWTDDAKSQLSWTEADDGTFWMPVEDYKDCFGFTAWASFHKDYHLSFTRFPDMASEEKREVVFDHADSAPFYVQVETVNPRMYNKIDGCEKLQLTSSFTIELSGINSDGTLVSIKGFTYPW